MRAFSGRAWERGSLGQPDEQHRLDLDVGLAGLHLDRFERQGGGREADVDLFGLRLELGFQFGELLLHGLDRVTHVIDPFNGSGTTCAVAQRTGRRWVGIDISPDYCSVAQDRLRKQNEAMREAAKAEKPSPTQKEEDSPDEDADGDAGACVAA